MEPQQIILACKTYTPSVPKYKTFGICTTFPESLGHCTIFFFPKMSPDLPHSVSGLSSSLARSPDASSPPQRGLLQFKVISGQETSGASLDAKICELRCWICSREACCSSMRRRRRRWWSPRVKPNRSPSTRAVRCGTGARSSTTSPSTSRSRAPSPAWWSSSSTASRRYGSHGATRWPPSRYAAVAPSPPTSAAVTLLDHLCLPKLRPLFSSVYDPCYDCLLCTVIYSIICDPVYVIASPRSVVVSTPIFCWKLQCMGCVKWKL